MWCSWRCWWWWRDKVDYYRYSLWNGYKHACKLVCRGIIIFQNASHTDREFTHVKKAEREEGNKALESLYIFLAKRWWWKEKGIRGISFHFFGWSSLGFLKGCKCIIFWYGILPVVLQRNYLLETRTFLLGSCGWSASWITKFHFIMMFCNTICSTFQGIT